MIRQAGGVAFVLRRVSGLLLLVYFVVWILRLPGQPLVPFAGDLARGGGSFGKAAELLLIFLVAAHALDGLSQIGVERFGWAHRRGYVLSVVLVLSAMIALFHFTLFFGGARP